MQGSHEKLWRAEQNAHQVTHERMRTLEKRVVFLQGINAELGKENKRLVEFVMDIFDRFSKEFTK